jgi:hypothetical protein
VEEKVPYVNALELLEQLKDKRDRYKELQNKYTNNSKREHAYIASGFVGAIEELINHLEARIKEGQNG